ncbi:MAG: hypothetical protein N2053_06240, partial [Chitinispirillaceae bacterium]|nr:hypothetical protein [Chitinispirillaceae bacterium]
IIGNTIHWIGSVVIDPFNPNRVFVTSGNGVFVTENCWEKIEKSDWEKSYYETRAVWKFASHGIEETVPLDLISIPGGPLVSVIGDYDGFVHKDVTKYPPFRHRNQDGTTVGTTTGIAFAAKKINVLVKVANDEAKTSWGGKINPVAISKDTGKTWQPCSNLPEGGEFHSGKVAISCDGEVIVWAPYVHRGDGSSPYNGMFRTIGGGYWTKCNGIDFYSYPVADPENKYKFYAYDKNSGYVFVSSDGGQSFSKAGLAGSNGFIAMRAAPKREGHLWIPLGSNGLTMSEDGGVTFTKISNVISCEAVGFGKEAVGKDYPAIYIYGTIGNITGVFQSIDKGNSWTRVNDDQHQYGGPANGEFVIGDMNMFGVVYMSTAGRGIACRLPADMVPIDAEQKRNNLYFEDKIINITRNSITIKINGKEKTTFYICDLKGRIIYKKESYDGFTIPLKKNLVGANKIGIVIVKNSKIYLKKRFYF